MHRSLPSLLFMLECLKGGFASVKSYLGFDIFGPCIILITEE